MSARGISRQLGERTCFNMTSGAEPSLVVTAHLSVLEHYPFPRSHGASVSCGGLQGACVEVPCAPPRWAAPATCTVHIK